VTGANGSLSYIHAIALTVKNSSLLGVDTFLNHSPVHPCGDGEGRKPEASLFVTGEVVPGTTIPRAKERKRRSSQLTVSEGRATRTTRTSTLLKLADVKGSASSGGGKTSQLERECARKEKEQESRNDGE